MKNLSYLITGGFGLIGSALANKLDGNITILSRSERNKERIKRSDIKILLKGLHQITQKDVEGIDVIYHCASTVDNYHILTDPFIDVRTNVEGTIQLLEACKDLPKKPKIIFLSTFFVYGNEYARTRTPINEESKTDPLALYPATKLCAESVIKLYSKLYKIPYIIVRLTNVYGEEEKFENRKKGALNYLIMKAIKHEDIQLYKGGNFFRDYIFVDDVVSALMFLEKHASNDLFLIGHGSPVKFKDMIDAILSTAKSKSKIIQIDPPEFHKIVGITDFVADTSKINSLGWKATIGYRESIKRIVKKYREIQKTSST